MPKIANLTVALSTLDRPEGLGSCLDALLAGEVLPAEIIVVDQGQAEPAKPILDLHRANSVSIVYHPQSRLGLSASRNAALAHASFPIIAFTDDDCVPDSRWVAVIEQAFNTPEPPDAMSGRVLPLEPEIPGTYGISLRTSTQRLDVRGKTIPWRIGTGGNLALRREWIDRMGSFDERLGAGSPGKAAEDADFIYRILRAGAHFRYEPDMLIYHARQVASQRLTSRRNYGFGNGAFCAKWIRLGDTYAIYMLSHWLFAQSRHLAGSLLRMECFQVYSRWLSITGTAAGFRYGYRLEERKPSCLPD